MSTSDKTNYIDSPLTAAMSQSQSTGIMEYVRRLEGVIKTERETFETRVVEEVTFRVYGTRAKYFAFGLLSGMIAYGIGLATSGGLRDFYVHLLAK